MTTYSPAAASVIHAICEGSAEVAVELGESTGMQNGIFDAVNQPRELTTEQKDWLAQQLDGGWDDDEEGVVDVRAIIAH